MARDGLKKQPATSTTTIMKNFETVVLGMLTFKDADSLTCACGTLDLGVPEKKEGNIKPLLKYILRRFNYEYAKGDGDGSSSW